MLFVLTILRIIFIGLMTFIGYDLASLFIDSPIGGHQYTGPIIGFSIGVVFIAVETKLKPIFRKTFFAVVIGLITGLSISYLISQIIYQFMGNSRHFETIKLLTIFIVCYLCISTVLQTKDKFKFIIPYFEFRGKSVGGYMMLIDLSVLTDNRLLDLLKTNIFGGQIGLPKSIYQELNKLLKDGKTLPQNRIVFALNQYQELKASGLNVIEIEDDFHATDSNAYMIRLAEMHQAKILTADIKLKLEAEHHKIECFNIHEISKIFKPPYLPGEIIKVQVDKAGDNKAQGVGYLDDATMVVVENAKDYIGQKIEVEITSYLQKNNGNMYFAQLPKNSEQAQ